MSDCILNENIIILYWVKVLVLLVILSYIMERWNGWAWERLIDLYHNKLKVVITVEYIPCLLTGDVGLGGEGCCCGDWHESIVLECIAESELVLQKIKDNGTAGIISRLRTLCQLSKVGRGGSLIDSSPFVRRVVGSNPRDFGQVLHSQLHVALRRETLTKYLCCVGSSSE